MTCQSVYCAYVHCTYSIVQCTRLRDLKQKTINLKKICLKNKPNIQCCGAGDGGAEIIFGPGAGAENKFE